MKPLIISLFILLLSYCGLPDASSFQELQFPALVVDDQYPFCTKNDTGGINITLKMQVYNPEASFSGYNIYMDTNTASLQEVKNRLTAQANNHIATSSGISFFNKNIEDTFMFLRTANILPTIKASEVPPDYNETQVFFTFTVTNLPIGQDNGGILTPATSYGFGVTAVSVSNIKESKLSNAIIVTTNNTEQPDGPCKVIAQRS